MIIIYLFKVYLSWRGFFMFTVFTRCASISMMSLFRQKAAWVDFLCSFAFFADKITILQCSTFFLRFLCWCTPPLSSIMCSAQAQAGHMNGVFNVFFFNSWKAGVIVLFVAHCHCVTQDCRHLQRTWVFVQMALADSCYFIVPQVQTHQDKWLGGRVLRTSSFPLQEMCTLWLNSF